MSRTQYRWTLGLTALVLSVMLGAAVWRAPAPPVEVSAAAAGCEDVFNSVTVKGTVRARREGRVTVGQPARVEEVYAAPGDVVEVGTPVLRVSYPEVSAQAAAAVSAFLAESGAAAPSAGAILYADMAGTVVQVPAAGDLLIPGVTVVRVADLSKMNIEAKVPELYAGELMVGQSANITPVSAPDRTLAASVQEIAPYAVQTFQLTGGGAATATVLCTLSLQEAADGLLPGSTVDVKLFTDQIADAVTVPYAAVRQDGTQEYVFVVDAAGTVHRRAIQTGYQLSRGVQVTHGLSAGEVVVTDNETALADGQQVRLYAGA